MASDSQTEVPPPTEDELRKALRMKLLETALTCLTTHGNKSGDLVDPLIVAYLQLAAAGG